MRALFALTTASVIACTFIACTIREPNEGSTDQAITGWNRLAGNRLAGNRIEANRLAGNRLAGNRLAGNALGTTTLEAFDETAEILQTEAGRDVYSYIVSCALPPEMTIEADVPGATDTAPPESNYTCIDAHCTFPGGVGVAPQWVDRRLDRVGQGWVSACLFSRVNANDTAESISLRGRHPGLAVTVEEMELYTAEEGAFYGNLFIDDPDPNVPPDWHACRGEAKAACAGDASCGAGLANRDCAQENPATPGLTYCGFVYAGNCGDYSASGPSAYACRTYNADAGTYGDCHADEGVGRWPTSTKYREVVTTWVANN
jgi:hypothetical protein